MIDREIGNIIILQPLTDRDTFWELKRKNLNIHQLGDSIRTRERIRAKFREARNNDE